MEQTGKQANKMDACPLCLGQAGKGGEERVQGITWALISLSVGNVSCTHKHTTCKRKADGMQKEDMTVLQEADRPVTSKWLESEAKFNGKWSNSAWAVPLQTVGGDVTCIIGKKKISKPPNCFKEET